MSTPASKITPESPSRPERGKRPCIVLADDCEATRDVTKLVLDGEYDVVTCNDGLAAWECIEQGEDVRALVTDVGMPRLDGIELIDRIRKSSNPRIKELPVIVVTGTTDKEIRRRAFVNGATGFILKPADPTQLKALLNAYVHLDQVKRELKQKSEALAEKSAALEEQSVTDALTGLRSRRYFMDRGEQDVAFSLRREKDLTVIRLDIDRFTDIAASHSKERMETLMKWLGALLLKNARTEDTVARLGESEFAILAMDTTIDAAGIVCNRLRDAAASQPFTDGNVTIPLSFRFGVADTGKDRAQTMEQLLALAQERLLAPPQIPEPPTVSNETPPAQDAPIESSSPAKQIIEPSSVRSDDPMDNMSVEELEQLIRQEVSGKAKRKNFGKDDVPPDLVSVEAALKLLAQGKAESLDPYLEPLVERLKPLLSYYQQQEKKK